MKGRQTIDQLHPYFSINIEKTVKQLKSNKNGLSEDEARKRLDQLGENKLPEKGKKSLFKLIIKQFKDFLVLILAIAAVISYLTGHMIDVYVIIGVILVNAAIGFVQEFKAEKSIESLKKLIKHDATVLRDGEKSIKPAPKLVPGDILLIEEGKTVPADARIIKQKNLHVEESSLTGESMPVEKQTEPLSEDTGLPDRTNMIFKGTHIARGSCKAIVTATGQHTELGKIAESLKDVDDNESEFRKKTGQLAKVMAGIAVGTALIVFLIGYFIRGFDFNEILLVTIATLVSSIPEGLPAVLSIVLAIGANRMAKQNAIIREFTATETAGSLNIILSDKTGTITKGILTIKKIFVPDESEYDIEGDGYETEGEIKKDGEAIDIEDDDKLAKAIAIAGICNDASMESRDEDEGAQKVSGDPTEVALMVLAKKTPLNKITPFKDIERIDDFPFNSKQKYRATLIAYPDGHKEILFVGAPEEILSLSSRVFSKDGPVDLNEGYRKQINQKIEAFGKKSMRVIGCAFKNTDSSKQEVSPDDGSELIFASLFGIIDPPRPEVNKEWRRYWLWVML